MKGYGLRIGVSARHIPHGHVISSRAGGQSIVRIVEERT
jgi:hypothetical protein